MFVNPHTHNATAISVLFRKGKPNSEPDTFMSEIFGGLTRPAPQPTSETLLMRRVIDHVMLSEGRRRSRESLVHVLQADAHSSSHASSPMMQSGAFHPASILPLSNTNYFQYRGSYTLPPCHESVIWHIMQAPRHMSPSQLRILTR